MIQMGTTRLMHLFPFDGIQQSLIDRFNEESRTEIEKIRDFIVLHYHTTERDDTPFWRYCRNMEIPETLTKRIRLFKEAAQAYQAEGELFRVDSWIAVMLGQRIQPGPYHPVRAHGAGQRAGAVAEQLPRTGEPAVERLPTQQEFISQYCRASSEVWG